MEQTIFDLMDSRSHIAPKRLVIPGPNDQQKQLLLKAAGTAPIHGDRVPWHLYEISENSRFQLGEVFVKNLKKRLEDVSSEQCDEAFSKALRGPYLLLMVAKHSIADVDIPKNENIISASCAVQNILLMAHSMGFGAGLSSGKALYGAELKKLLRLDDDDEPLVFITIGTVKSHRAERVRASVASYSSTI